MRAISLFSGAGGFELGFERAGIETVLQAENDPWCLRVLERHWPEVERVDDVCKVDASALRGRCGDLVGVGNGADGERLGAAASAASGVDLIYGGFPCQDVSVAGKRAGLSGDRSGLWYEFHRILRELRPQWAVIENVPGLLSSNHGRDLALILLAMEELGYGWAYRVLDARWFGVPQRRRRVFIVGCLGSAARAASVLAVCESCGGHTPPGSQAKQDIAPTLDDGARRASVDLPMISFSSKGGGGGAVEQSDMSPTVMGTRGNGGVPPAIVAATLSGGGHPGSNMPGRHHEDDDNLVVAMNNGQGEPNVSTDGTAFALQGDAHSYVAAPVANALQANQGEGRGWSGDRGDGSDNLVVGSQVSAGQARPLVARASGYRMDIESETFVVADTLRNEYGQQSYRGDGADNLIAEVADPITTVEGKTWTHEGNTFRTHNLISGVRRLTPLECERLMGWPDEWTRFTADGAELADSHRYRLCGNGVVATVAEWVGHRLMVAEKLRQLHALGVVG